MGLFVAISSGVCPLSFFIFLSAPLANRKDTILVCPRFAAQCNGDLENKFDLNSSSWFCKYDDIRGTKGKGAQ